MSPEASVLGFLVTMTGIRVDMHPASADIAEGPFDAPGDTVCLPFSAGELMSMVVSAVGSPRTRSTPGDARTATVERRRARMHR
jgi:hypothetical protein